MSADKIKVAPTVEYTMFPRQLQAIHTPATEVLLGGAAGGGKALALDTPIMTGKGWSTMGDLKIGETVFDELGKPCRVVGATEVMVDRRCYRVTFDDNSQIVADANHEWETSTDAERRAEWKASPEYRAQRRANRPKRGTGAKPWLEARNALLASLRPNRDASEFRNIRTTAEIFDTLKVKGYRTNHSVRLGKAIEMPAVDLPIPPYVLAAWLGNGSKNSGQFCTGDLQMMQNLEAEGYEYATYRARYHYNIYGLKVQLRALGVLENKHVPEIYMRGSVDQRMALLQGFMDTDGYCAEDGACEFCNTNKLLSDAVYELAAGLGLKPTRREGRAMLEGRDCGPKWMVYWTATLQVFRVARKGDRLNEVCRVTQDKRYIVDCVQVESVPVRCIQVDSPSHLYLCGEAMIPTHNSFCLRLAAIIWCQEAPGLQVYLFRKHYKDLILNHMTGSNNFFQMLNPLIQSGHASIVDMEIRFWNGSKIHLCHLQHEKNVYDYQGGELHVLMFDELTHFTEFSYRFLRGRVRLGGLKIPDHLKGRFPRIIAGSNPGNIGHHWVKKMFIDQGEFVIRQILDDEEGGMLRQFIPSRMDDNPALMDNDPNYRKRLRGLGDAVLVKAMEDGDWDVVAGAMFGSIWRKERHICKPFPIPTDWEMWRAADDGFASPACCVWFARNPFTKCIYVIRELYRAGMLPDEYAQEVLRGDKEIKVVEPDNINEDGTLIDAGEIRYHGKVLEHALMDSAAFANVGSGQNDISRAQAMNRLGCKWKPVDKWPGSRIARVQELHRLLTLNPHMKNGTPGIVFFDTCKDCIRTIPSLPRDKKNIEDVDTDAEDHGYDACTYGLSYKKGAVRMATISGF